MSLLRTALVLLPLNVLAQMNYHGIESGQQAINFWSAPVSINSATATQLWEHTGLSQQAIFELITYREAVGRIVDPSELYLLPHWTDSIVQYLVETLPLDHTTPAWTKLKTLYSTNNASHSIWSRLSSQNFTAQAKLGKNQFTGHLTAKTGPLTLVMGHHLWHLGGNLLSPVSQFGSRAFETFGLGPRGAAFGGSPGLAAHLQQQHGPYNLHLFAGNNAAGRVLGGAVGTAQYTAGLSTMNERWNIHGKWTGDALRAYGEVLLEPNSPTRYQLGASTWYEDVHMHMQTNGSDISFQLDAHLNWGSVAGGITEKRLWVSWQNSAWEITGTRKGLDAGAPFRWKATWRSAERDGLHSVAGYVHGSSYGWSIAGAAMGLKWVAYGIKASSQQPLWRSSTSIPGSLGFRGVYSNATGLEIARRGRYVNLMCGVQLAEEEPGKLSWSVQLRTAYALETTFQ